MRLKLKKKSGLKTSGERGDDRMYVMMEDDSARLETKRFRRNVFVPQRHTLIETHPLSRPLDWKYSCELLHHLACVLQPQGRSDATICKHAAERPLTTTSQFAREQLSVK